MLLLQTDTGSSSEQQRHLRQKTKKPESEKIPASFYIAFTELFSFRGFLCSSFSNRCFGCSCFSSRCFSGSSRCRLLRTTGASCFFSSSLSHVLIIVNQFDKAHFSVISQTVTGFDNTGITSRTICNLYRDFLEEFSNGIFVLQIAEYYTTRISCIVF